MRSANETPLTPGLLAEYFANRDLSGEPLRRTEPLIDFDWQAGAPNGVPIDNFSARWSGLLVAPVSGEYRLGTVSDDGVRLWLDGEPLIDRWDDHAATRDMRPVTLVQGQAYPITMTYYERRYSAVAKLQWQLPGAANPVPVPASALAQATAAAPTTASGKYLGPAPAAPAATPPANFTGLVTVRLEGNDQSGNGSAARPYRTLARAASAAVQGQTIDVGPGVFVETQPARLAPGVSLKGAGQDLTVFKSSGVALSAGVSSTDPNFKRSPEGSLIQLLSQPFKNAWQTAGNPADMLPPVDGRQTLSGFTIDGNAKSLKAGVWVQNRSNVTMHHVTFRDLQQRGAVFARSDMDWFTPLPDAMWMRNTQIHDCIFKNSGADIEGESLGNLNLAGLDGAYLYNLKIEEDQGYGIKFIYVGHFRNLKLWNADIQVPESDKLWGEDAAIELWNLSRGNEIFNVNASTWLSFVNHVGLYDNVSSPTDNLWLHHVRIVDADGKSNKEAVEVALPGMTISDSYFQDKGLGLGVWMEGKNQIAVLRNVFARVRNSDPSWAAEAAVFVPDTTTNLSIHNNVFDRAGTAIHMRGTTSNVSIVNNLMLDTVQQDVYSASRSYRFANNLKHTAAGTTAAWRLEGRSPDASNLVGNPGLLLTGDRWGTHYRPARRDSFVVDRGTDVGLPSLGGAPDIGRWEWNP